MAGTSSKIPIEIVSDEEMVSIEAALASAACSSVTPAAVPALYSPSSAPQLRKDKNSIASSSVKAKRRLFVCAEPDIEDYGNFFDNKKKKARKVAGTLLDRFRSKRGLFVTDVSKTEWCEKQMEFSLFSDEECKNNNEGKRAGDEECFRLVFGGGRKNNEAMRAGIDRHVELQNEILEPVRVEVKSCEDRMALKLLNFINGVNQLLFEGLTRELPIVSFASAEGIWMVGNIDEIRIAKSDRNPILVETKTRESETVPAGAQKRNGRIQAMCYKYLWDNLVGDHDFPCREFYDYFELSPQRTLCKDLQKASAESGFNALTLDDVVMYYQNTCKMLPRAHDQLVLRYESQKDKSLLEEDKFAYNGGWLKRRIRNCLEFWLGQREANFVAEGEDWKCGYCDFAPECPAAHAYADTDESAEDLSSDDSRYYY